MHNIIGNEELCHDIKYKIIKLQQKFVKMLYSFLSIFIAKQIELDDI